MFKEEERNDVICENGVYMCPKCNSKRITLHSQCMINKLENINTGKIIDPVTKKPGMSNRKKAQYYDMASPEGLGCWSYECRKCGWNSDVFTE